MKKLLYHIPIFMIGGLLYMLVEILWRGHSHWTMFLLGGICFVSIGLLNEIWPSMRLWQQMILGALIVTAAELVVGIIVNIWLGWHVWDYSSVPFNFMGQICLPYFFAWMGLSAIAVPVEDWVHKLFGHLDDQ